MSDVACFATWFRTMQGETAIEPPPPPTLTDRLLALRDAVAAHTPKPLPMKDLVPWILELCEEGASLGEIAAEVGLSHGSVIPRIMYGTSSGGKWRSYPIATQEQRERYRALMRQRCPVPRGHGRRRFRKRLQVLLNQDIGVDDFRAQLEWMLTSQVSRDEADLVVKLGVPNKRGQKGGALHSCSIPVTTPRGSFVSITAASEAFEITRQAGSYRLRRGEWRVCER